MLILADTNILLRSINEQDPHYLVADHAVSSLSRNGDDLCIAPQNIIEFWAVATRPISQNGLGLTSQQAIVEINSIERYLSILAYKLDILMIWQNLVSTFKIVGKQTHDAHLVAFMHAHSIDKILTFNFKDFNRFPGITAIDPAAS